jgi:hypothetical protein
MFVHPIIVEAAEHSASTAAAIRVLLLGADSVLKPHPVNTRVSLLPPH